MLPSNRHLRAIGACFLLPRGGPEVIRKWQDARLRDLIRHAAAEVPFYRRLYQDAGVRPDSVLGVNDLPRLPLVSRQALLALPARDVLARSTRPENLIVHSSSGMSGQSFPARHTHWELQVMRCFMFRAFRSYGLRANHRLLRIWNFTNRREHVPLRRRLADRAGFFRRDHCLWPAPLDRVIETLLKQKPEVIRSYPSVFLRLGRRLAEQAWPMPKPKLLLTDGEPLTSAMRRRIEELWEAPVHSMYGCSEVMMIASECPVTRRYHLCEDSVVAEVLREDGTPAAPGEEGELVATGLHGYAAPLVRYRTGDIVIRDRDLCPCGAPYHTLQAVCGRDAERFRFDSAGRIDGWALGRRVQEAAWVHEYRILQVSGTELRLEVIPARSPSSEDRERLASAVSEALGGRVEVALVLVDDLPCEPGGKLKRCLPLPTEYSTTEGTEFSKVL